MALLVQITRRISCIPPSVQRPRPMATIHAHQHDCDCAVETYAIHSFTLLLIRCCIYVLKTLTSTSFVGLSAPLHVFASHSDHNLPSYPRRTFPAPPTNQPTNQSSNQPTNAQETLSVHCTLYQHQQQRSNDRTIERLNVGGRRGDSRNVRGHQRQRRQRVTAARQLNNQRRRRRRRLSLRRRRRRRCRFCNFDLNYAALLFMHCLALRCVTLPCFALP